MEHGWHRHPMKRKVYGMHLSTAVKTRAKHGQQLPSFRSTGIPFVKKVSVSLRYGNLPTQMYTCRFAALPVRFAEVIRVTMVIPGLLYRKQRCPIHTPVLIRQNWTTELW